MLVVFLGPFQTSNLSRVEVIHSSIMQIINSTHGTITEVRHFVLWSTNILSSIGYDDEIQYALSKQTFTFKLLRTFKMYSNEPIFEGRLYSTCMRILNFDF